MNRPSQTHRPRKRFGQNFLRDKQVIHRIIEAVAPREEDHIVEIGPGDGALTRGLAKAAGRLDCIELDRDLARQLALEFQGRENVRIHCADVLRFDPDDIAPLGRELRVVGNLPYNISTPVLFHLLKMSHRFTDMTFMLQREVVNRMTATPGSRDYGRLSVMLAYYCSSNKLFAVPPGAFRPQPRVVSTVVRLRPHYPLPLPAADEAGLAALVRAAFSQRRKTLRNCLRQYAGPELLRVLGLDPEARPEQLEPGDYIRISNAIAAGQGK